MGDERCRDRGSSFFEVLESLVNETVDVNPTGTTTTIHGKLISVHSTYIAIASCEHHGEVPGGDGPGHGGSVRLAWIPVNRISVVSEH